ncbi:hypothetical protein [Arthrobacter cavernae]|uniref:Uncharacterized protein n=1 Tax=Arthrobacter cavernae TaxID=2817681 RepID=A0A939KKM1_9MICC|nr:hypothetical protein [Arthrobacter cavernae]MBO1269862.1 hypothetical protein [Arthrobacter cavernae]
MAGDKDAGKPFGHRCLPEHGLCIVEQLVKSTRLGDKDFQMLGGLTTHDEQLPSQELGSPQCLNPSSLGVCCVLDRIQNDGITTNKQATGAGAILDDPYQFAVVGAVIDIACVKERIEGPDFNAFPVLK